MLPAHALLSLSALAGTLAVAVPLAASNAPDQMRQRELYIEQTLVARLGPDATTIRAAVLGTKVVLSGEVAHRVTQEMAKEVVLSLDGVQRARNRVQARDDLKLTEGLALLEGKDAQLEIEVKHAISRSNRAVANALEVEAVAGVVSLRGTLGSSAEKATALRTAANVAGVVEVLDLLRTRD